MCNIFYFSQRARCLATLFVFSLLSACASAPRHGSSGDMSGRADGGFSRAENAEEFLASLKLAEEGADEAGRGILVTGRVMALESREIVRGSCWDFINAVYNRSGYPNSKAGRVTVFKGTKENGPYAGAELIRPGDWLYYVNHSYNGIEHSGIFVSWLDPVSRSALILSYGGEQRHEPARYLPYDISNVYQIIRPAEKPGVVPQLMGHNAPH